VGKPRHGKPDPFGHGSVYSTASEPVDDVELAAAVDRFVQAYVIKSKRERVHGKLIGPKRGDTLRGLLAFVDPNYRTELERSAGFPQHLQERFGDLCGILISEFSAFKLTIVAAAYKVAFELDESSLFIAPHLALFIPEVGHPTLIRRQQVA
jgi:hypothetical protein